MIKNAILRDLIIAAGIGGLVLTVAIARNAYGQNTSLTFEQRAVLDNTVLDITTINHCDAPDDVIDVIANRVSKNTKLIAKWMNRPAGVMLLALDKVSTDEWLAMSVEEQEEYCFDISASYVL